MNSRKKAFTLAELLVVVVVLGVLASVAIPKLKRVVETHKTTEAEEMMAAIRTEQEKRCVFGKEYITDINDVAKIPVLAKAGKSQNYNYQLLTKGIQANKGNDYSLKMYYKTGQLCCSGSGCDNLNKNYPDCPEQEPADECAGPIQQEVLPPTPCEGDSSETVLCGCNNAGTQTRTRTCHDGEWSSWSDWSECSAEPCPKDCEGASSETVQCGCNNAGTQTRTRTCNNGEWSSWSDWSECSAEDCGCDDSHEDGLMEGVACPANQCGSGAVTWHCGEDTNWEWRGSYDYSSCSAQPDNETESCNDGTENTKSCSYSCVNDTWTKSCDDSACAQTQDETCGSKWPEGEEQCAFIGGNGGHFVPSNIYNPDRPGNNCCEFCSSGTIWYSKEERCITLSKTSSPYYAYRTVKLDNDGSPTIKGETVVGTYTETSTSGGSGYGYGGYGSGFSSGLSGGSGSSSSSACTSFTLTKKGSASPCTNSFCTNLDDLFKSCYNDSWSTVIQPTRVGVGNVSSATPPEGQACSISCHNGGTWSGTYHCSLAWTSDLPIPDTICASSGAGWSAKGQSQYYNCSCDNANPGKPDQCDLPGTTVTSRVQVYDTRGLEAASAYTCSYR